MSTKFILLVITFCIYSCKGMSLNDSTFDTVSRKINDDSFFPRQEFTFSNMSQLLPLLNISSFVPAFDFSEMLPILQNIMSVSSSFNSDNFIPRFFGGATTGNDDSSSDSPASIFPFLLSGANFFNRNFLAPDSFFGNMFGNFSLLDSLFNRTAQANSTTEIIDIDGILYRVNKTVDGGTLGNGATFFSSVHHVIPFSDQNSDNEVINEEPVVYDDANEYEDFGADVPILERQKRYSFDDFLETILRMKFGLFIKPENETATRKTVSDVEFIDNNDIENVSDLKLIDEKPIDLSSDTRVNYVRGHHRNVENSNTDAEVFDWALLKRDEKKNSGRPSSHSAGIQTYPGLVDPSDNHIQNGLSSSNLNDGAEFSSEFEILDNSHVPVQENEESEFISNDNSVRLSTINFPVHVPERPVRPKISFPTSPTYAYSLGFPTNRRHVRPAAIASYRTMPRNL